MPEFVLVYWRCLKARYYSLQPRLSISYRAGENMILKTSWAKMQQSQHTLIKDF